MQIRIAILALSTVVCCSFAHAQSTGTPKLGASGWRAPANGSASREITADYGADYDVEIATNHVTPTAATSPITGARPAPVTPGGRVTRAQVSKGSSTLPNNHGQVWREYDISPYTMRVRNTERPEQAIVDWILRETGYEAWHSTPVGLLSADRRTLRVYHTPQMQSVVAEIADRFVNSRAETHGFGLRIVTIRNPNWRTRALPLMKSIPVQSPGVQGWILAKEDAALLMSELARRTDYREHSPPRQMVHNGQTLAISSMRQRPYTKGIIHTGQTWPGYQPELGQIEEGFSLEFSPLLSLDTATTDAVIKVRLAQVEKMLAVKLEVPSNIAPNQRAECQVPQMTTVHFHERFRWPTDQVLLLSMGVVATPGPKKPNALADMLSLSDTAPRADALLFVESKGPMAATLPGGVSPAVTASRPNQTFHGRY